MLLCISRYVVLALTLPVYCCRHYRCARTRRLVPTCHTSARLVSAAGVCRADSCVAVWLCLSCHPVCFRCLGPTLVSPIASVVSRCVISCSPCRSGVISDASLAALFCVGADVYSRLAQFSARYAAGSLCGAPTVSAYDRRLASGCAAFPVFCSALGDLRCLF